jgi:hypothetical protein
LVGLFIYQTNQTLNFIKLKRNLKKIKVSFLMQLYKVLDNNPCSA